MISRGETTGWKEEAKLHEEAMWDCIHSEKFQEALQHATKMLSVLLKALPRDHDEIAEVNQAIGQIYICMGNSEDALRHLKAALEIKEKNDSANPLDIAQLQHFIGQELSKINDYENALTYFYLALETREKELPDCHLETALTRHWIGENLSKTGHVKEAIEYYKAALEARQRSFPPDPVALEASHHALCLTYGELEQDEPALTHALQTLTIRKANLPSDHPYIATAYQNVGVSLINMKQYVSALWYLRNALAINEKNASEDNLETIEVQRKMLAFAQYNIDNELDILQGWERKSHEHMNFSVYYATAGDYVNALQHEKIVLEILLNELPNDHPDIAESNFIIGGLYNTMEQYEDALRHLTTLIEANEKNGTADSVKVANVFHLAGIACFHLAHRNSQAEPGHYIEMSEKYFRRALVVREQELPLDHPDTVLSRHWLGEVLARNGNAEEALRYLSAALEARERDIPEDLVAIAGSHAAMCIAYKCLAQYESALEHAYHSLRIRKSHLPHNHLDIAEAHHGIGTYHCHLSQYDDALRHLEAAIAIRKGDPSSADPLEAAETFHLAGLACIHLKKHDDALLYLKTALSTYESLSPQSRVIIAQIHYRIAATFDRLKKTDEFFKHLKISMDIREELILNEDAPVQYMDVIYVYYDIGIQDRTLEFTRLLMKKLPALFKEIMRTENERFRADQLQEAIGVLSCINSVACSFPGETNEREIYDLLLQTKDIGLESEHIRRAAHSTEQQIEELIDHHMSEMTSEAVLKHLPVNCALIEFGWFDYRKAALERLHISTVSERLALFLPSSGRYFIYFLCDGEITPHYFEEPESVINELIYATRKKITRTDSDGTPAPLDVDAELSELYELLIKPFEDKLRNINHLYIAPEGELFKLPFELLRNKNGKTLANANRSISYVSSGRDLVRAALWGVPIAKYTDAVILADPKYDLTGHTKVRTDERGPVLKHSRELFKLEPFTPLTYGKSEADSIFRILNEKADKRYGVAAKKNTLQEITASSGKSPDIIHISSHGFSFEKQMIIHNALKSMHESEFVHSGAEDPLLRCGLAFAGVNNWLKTDMSYPLEEYGDGIMTAKDVLGLDLCGTDLLVLSACQTGLGEIKNAEGIKSLRRSFELAGIHTVLCTLWSVEELSCALLMNEFYANLLEKGMDKLEALINAKLFLSKMTNLEMKGRLMKMGLKAEAICVDSRINHSPKEEHARNFVPFADSFYWAGYVLQGQTGNKAHTHDVGQRENIKVDEQATVERQESKHLTAEIIDEKNNYNRMAIRAFREGNYRNALDNFAKAVEAELGETNEQNEEAVFLKMISSILTYGMIDPKAMELIDLFVADYERKLGDDTLEIAKVYLNVGATCLLTGEFGTVEKWYKKAMGIQLKTIGMNHPETITTLFRAAELYEFAAMRYESSKDQANALEWYENAFNVYNMLYGEGKPDPVPAVDPAYGIGYDLEAYTNLLNWFDKKALEWLEKIYAIYFDIYGDDHLNVPITCNSIATYYRHHNNLACSLEWAERAFAILEKTQATNHLTAAITCENIAIVHNLRDEYLKAIKWYEKAFAIRKDVLGNVHPHTFMTCQDITMAYYDLEDYTNTLKWGERLLAICVEAKGKDSQSAIQIADFINTIKEKNDEVLEWCKKAISDNEKEPILDNMSISKYCNAIANIHWGRDEYLEAIYWIKKETVIVENELGKEHPSVFDNYCIIAKMYRIQDDNDNALEYYHKALTICEKIRGDNHPETIAIYCDIAKVYTSIIMSSKSEDDHVQTMETLNKALPICVKVYGVESHETAMLYNNLGFVHEQLGDYSQAIECLDKALALCIIVHGEKHPETAKSYGAIGLVHSRFGENKHALEYYGKALMMLEECEKDYGEEYSETATSYSNIGRAYFYLNDYKQALEYQKKALAKFEKIFGQESPHTVMLSIFIGLIYDKLGDYSQALEYLEKGLVMNEIFNVHEHPETAIYYNTIGMIKYKMDKPEQALNYFNKALEIHENVYGKDHPDSAIYYCNIGQILAEQANYPKAKSMLEKAILMFDQTIGFDHPSSSTAKELLAEVLKKMDDGA